MKTTSKFLTILAIVIFCMINVQVFAEGVGFVDYKKVQDNYAYAKAAAKEIDSKALELQQYIVDKEKQYKMLETPLKKQNFENATKKEFEKKQNDYVTFKLKKEEDSIPCLQALFTAQKTQARGLPYWQSIEELQTEK